MNDEELLQYSRQIMLPQIDLEGQQRLLDSRVLIIGLGGLGAPVALYLAAAGVGELVLSDYDEVDLSNLQRQIIHCHQSIGEPKVESARQSLERINPRCRVEPLAERLEEDVLHTRVEAADVVVDCSDNFATRFAINRASVATDTPLVSGSAIRWEGQVAVFNDQPGAPCYHCLYGDSGELDASCAANGVLAPVVGIIGSIQATETIKLLTGAGEPLSGRLLLLDALSMELRSLKLRADPGCPVCSTTSRRSDLSPTT
ncbi:MAG: molybdopterin-synthase adenylyltransferase MoeB [Gammaproteobacteria bacterium]|nr:MAG: molybdopterin-synthase adenylyltransferase MoeB [Gammaproteobacteria bacterium]RTZ73966.1 MAG: molybdopterin-synthase adenylyltransferase MoeB [Gammaproteobacteria bacterium]